MGEGSHEAGSVKAWEGGDAVPRLYYRRRLAKVLGVSVGDLGFWRTVCRSATPAIRSCSAERAPLVVGLEMLGRRSAREC
jgi:hypothetical protein